MRRRAALLAAAALLALPAGAAAETVVIAMPGKYFDPGRSTAVAGDLVVFRNDDLVTHDVRIAGGVFDSGPITRFTAWSQRIDQPGAYPFVCTLHPFMSGNLEVYAATLSASPATVLAGEQLTLSGRATAGSAQVAVERSLSGGPWAAAGAAVVPAPDGSFKVRLPAVAGASYRASTPAGPGQVVTPRVSARVEVHLGVERTRRHTTLRVRTMPATTGFSATLQLYSRWHFEWRSKRRAKLDSHGRAAFRLPASSRSYARVALGRGASGPALVHSGVVKLSNGRATRDPNTIMPPGGGRHDAGGDAAGGGHAGHH